MICSEMGIHFQRESDIRISKQSDTKMGAFPLTVNSQLRDFNW